jgi:hypothetical protein
MKSLSVYLGVLACLLGSSLAPAAAQTVSVEFGEFGKTYPYLYEEDGVRFSAAPGAGFTWGWGPFMRADTQQTGSADLLTITAVSGQPFTLVTAFVNQSLFGQATQLTFTANNGATVEVPALYNGTLTFVGFENVTSVLISGTAATKDSGPRLSLDDVVVDLTALTDSDGDGILDDVDNCPDAVNGLQDCDSDADCFGSANSCDEAGLCSEQDDLDDDGDGDVCDLDDDGDGIPDADDTCPITFDLGMDSDFDGIDDACDTSFDEGSVAEAVSAVVENVTESLVTQASDVPGVNGLLSKLQNIAGLVNDATAAFNDGLLTLADYQAALALALDELDGFDQQLAAKSDPAKTKHIDAAVAAAVAEQSAVLAAIIESLIANAS